MAAIEERNIEWLKNKIEETLDMVYEAPSEELEQTYREDLDQLRNELAIAEGWQAPNPIDLAAIPNDENLQGMRSFLTAFGRRTAGSIADSYDVEYTGVLPSHRCTMVHCMRSEAQGYLVELSTLWDKLETTIRDIDAATEALNELIDPENI